ncbi:flavin monoamine oxidase family protein [Andreprevotia chitinilytica]|uniref:flavin monoamine oxidase family protein n=1 Tax=Andreprevotia chitinilytica TaxID=396808 RepID=UPI000555BDA9|nr:FAD-dependent oxidoreductase [Andreprevotia chitinilytica]
MITLNDIPHSTGSQPNLEIDVAVIGAGVSGLYTGWRLLGGEFKPDGQRPASVHVFDLADRIGGRLLSIKLPGMDVIGELGGMRYMTSQEMVTSLIQNVFKLPYDDFPMGDPADLYFYLRCQRFHADAWTDAQAKGEKFPVRYTFKPGQDGFSPDQLFNKIVYDVLMADPWFAENYSSFVQKDGEYIYNFRLTSRQWNEIKPELTYCFADSPFNGMKVNNIGFWNLINDRVGQDAYDFLADAGGYYSNTINWNAAEAFPYMVGDFSNAGTEYRTIKDGYDQIAYALAQAYTGLSGSQLWLENRLETFTRADDTGYRYQLTFWNEQGKYHWHVRANTIVLAMPRRSLELLDQQNFFFHKETARELQKNIASVIMEPSFKLLMGFDEPWWTEDFGATSGESVTDLPMRQCYYFGVDPKNSHSLFLSSYNDMRTVPFWQVLMRNRATLATYETRPTRLVSQAQITSWHGQTRLPGDPVPKAMVEEAMRQVRELHGPQNQIPDPYIARLQDWTEDPYGGGYHAWCAHVSVKDIMPYMRRPKPTESIHITGEAYSDAQGWVEGAFCVTELMLQEWFDMAWPSWLNRTYYLGW